MKHVWVVAFSACVLIAIAFVCNFAADVNNGCLRLLLFSYTCNFEHPQAYGSIIGLAVNVGAFLLAATMCLKHKHTFEYFYETRHRRRMFLISSRCFLIIGMVSVSGLIVIANFQIRDQDKEKNRTIFVVRIIGVFMTFGGGLLYCWCISIASFWSPAQMAPRRLAQCRMTAAGMGLIFFVGMFAQALDVSHEHRILPNGSNGASSNNEIPHYISAICECGLTLSFLFLLSTIAYDLRGSKLKTPKLQLRSTEQIVQQTAFLNNYRLEYMSSLNLNSGADLNSSNKPDSTPPRSCTASPASIRTTSGVITILDRIPEEPIANTVPVSAEREPEPITYEYRPSPVLSRIVRRESQNQVPPQQQRPTAFSYIPDMPNPFNQLGQLRKVYDSD